MSVRVMQPIRQPERECVEDHSPIIWQNPTVLAEKAICSGKGCGSG